MAAKRKSTRSTISAKARSAALTDNPRSRVRELTIRALRDRDLGRADISKVVQEVLDGAADAVDRSIPAERTSVLRQVFAGLSEAVDTAAAAGLRAARGAGQRGRAIVEHSAPATRRIRAANEDFLSAVSTFARKSSSELGDELETLVRQARRTGEKVGASAGEAARAADGRLLELTGEAARAGVTVARRAAGQIALAASGLLEGLGEVVLPQAKARPAAPRARAAPRSTRKKTRRGKRRSAKR